jgi:hypothetical protein
MRKLGLFLTLAAICLGVGACDEENPVKPPEFAVTIQVKTPAGDPVEGLRVGLVNDTPYFQDGKDAAKAAVVIQFSLATPARGRISIKDIEGREIQVVADELMPIGWFQMVWDGTDFEGIHQPSGRYTAHLVVMEIDTDLLLYEERTDMLLAMLDSSRVPVGYTDADGKLVLKDEKLFPHLYDRPDMTATDETGETIGTLTLTPTMRVSLVDTLAGRSMGFKEDILAGMVLELVWDPPLLKARETFSAAEFPAVQKDLPPVEFELRLVFPNPFN